MFLPHKYPWHFLHKSVECFSARALDNYDAMDNSSWCSEDEGSVCMCACAYINTCKCKRESMNDGRMVECNKCLNCQVADDNFYSLTEAKFCNCQQQVLRVVAVMVLHGSPFIRP